MMDTINIVLNSIKVMMKKPVMFIYMAVMISLFILVDYIYRFSVIISLVKNLKMGDIVSMMQLLIQPGIFIKVLVFIIVFIIVISMILAVFFSGLFSKLQNALYSKKKLRESFIKSLKKYYMKTVWTFMRTGLILILLIFALLIAAIPAIIVSIAAYNSGGIYILLATIIDVISALILFLVFYFVKMYLVFWFPSMLNYKKSLKIARMVVNKNFWKIIYNFIATDVVMIFGITITIISLAERNIVFLSVPLTIIGAVIIIVAIVFFFTYVFTAFKYYVDRLREEYRPVDEEE
jgi:hypothetical protein